MKTILSNTKILPSLKYQTHNDALDIIAECIEQKILTFQINVESPDCLTLVNLASERYPQICLGVSNVTHVSEFENILTSKAQFVSCPGFQPTLVSLAQIYDYPILPGVASISEALHAREMGIEVIKLYPIETLGGAQLIRAFQNSLPKMLLCPAAMDSTSTSEYLSYDNVIAVEINDFNDKVLTKNNKAPSLRLCRNKLQQLLS